MQNKKNNFNLFVSKFPGFWHQILDYFQTRSFVFVRVSTNIFLVLVLTVSLTGVSLAASVDKNTLIDLANKSRLSAGLSPLKTNPELEQAALAKAQDMLTYQYFEHTSPQGITPWNFIESHGYQYLLAGENLAMGFTESENIHRAWMASSTHRDNIINPRFKDVGLAVVKGDFESRPTHLIVEMFGTRQSVISRQIENLVFHIQLMLIGEPGQQTNTPLFTDILNP